MAGLERYPHGYPNKDYSPVYSGNVWDNNSRDKYAGGDNWASDRTSTHISSLGNQNMDNLENEENFKKHVALGVSLASLITGNLLSHPFIVLRRQCQVHNTSSKYHILPLSLVPVIVHLHQRQGITTLWKGIGSVLMVRGMSLAIEDVISKFTPWPKEISWNSSLKSFGQHLLLKCTSLAIVTPFYSASLVETVQSEIASDKPGIFDVFKEGLVRFLSWGAPYKGRMLPIWALVLPTVMYGLLKYLLSITVRGSVSRIIRVSRRHEQQKQGAYSKDILSESTYQDIELTSTLAGVMISEALLFPLETILHRLHLQGTRTIIDNLDSGYSVEPILTSYTGALDCYDSSVSKEGFSGLYKGFGALVLQFSVHLAVIRISRILLTEVTNFFHQSNKIEEEAKVTISSGISRDKISNYDYDE